MWVNNIDIFNTALPGAGANILVADIVPKFDPGILRIYVCISIAGVFSVYRTDFNAGTSVVELLNAGSALVAGASYIFYVPWVCTESINLRLSTTGGTIYKLQIDEGDD